MWKWEEKIELKIIDITQEKDEINKSLNLVKLNLNVAEKEIEQLEAQNSLLKDQIKRSKRMGSPNNGNIRWLTRMYMTQSQVRNRAVSRHKKIIRRVFEDNVGMTTPSTYSSSITLTGMIAFTACLQMGEYCEDIFLAVWIQSSMTCQVSPDFK